MWFFNFISFFIFHFISNPSVIKPFHTVLFLFQQGLVSTYEIYPCKSMSCILITWSNHSLIHAFWKCHQHSHFYFGCFQRCDIPHWNQYLCRPPPFTIIWGDQIENCNFYYQSKTISLAIKMVILCAGVFEGTGWSAELSFSSGKWLYQNSIAGNCKQQFPPSVELEVLYHQAGKGVGSKFMHHFSKIHPFWRSQFCLLCHLFRLTFKLWKPHNKKW